MRNAVVEASNREQQRFWNHWLEYCHDYHVDPYFAGTPTPIGSPIWDSSPSELAKVHFPPALASECKRYSLHFEQSARPLNWTDDQTRATNQADNNTTPASSDS